MRNYQKLAIALWLQAKRDSADGMIASSFADYPQKPEL